ncbi:hypothetical protein ACIPZC_08020 [Pseudomonas sp. NPDC089743]|uniref:hypothetical protein n=1 Tax=Pseudomonas sp. NPDC089743 TaxID=3364471 RepID=UPI003816A2F3
MAKISSAPHKTQEIRQSVTKNLWGISGTAVAMTVAINMNTFAFFCRPGHFAESPPSLWKRACPKWAKDGLFHNFLRLPGFREHLLVTRVGYSSGSASIVGRHALIAC